MEVKTTRSQVGSATRKMGFEGLLFVPGQNNGVGLALFWKIKHMAKVPAYSKNFIDVDVDLFQKKT